MERTLYEEISMNMMTRYERSCYFQEYCRGEEERMETIKFPLSKTKATTTKAASVPTEISANAAEVDLTSTTELEVSSEDAACLPVPEVLNDYFLLE